MRRRLTPEPFAAAADLSRRCAGFAAALAAIAVLMGRSGSVDPRGAVAVLGFALLFAAAAVALACRSAVVIWRTGRRGAGRAVAALLLACAVLGYPGALAIESVRLPAVSDVSTDPGAPPAFSTRPAAVAARGGMVHEEPTPEQRDAGRRGYPGLQPVSLDVPVDQAYELALKAVRGRGWRVVDAQAPEGKSGTGHIDAVATAGVMALPDDVVIRIRPASGQTRVDIRSASRFGRLDVGTNAARVQSLSDELLDAAS